MNGFPASDDSSDDDGVTFVFERLDITDGPRHVISTIDRRDYVRHFRTLSAKYPVRLIEFDARASDHPDRLAEEAALRDRMHAYRVRHAKNSKPAT